MKTQARERRHNRIAKKMRGTQTKPRLVVFRSQKHLYAQLVNDTNQKVITSCSTLTKDFRAKNIKSTNKEAAVQLGKLVSEQVLTLGIKEICFDRAGYKYHGRVQALAQGLREGGLKF